VGDHIHDLFALGVAGQDPVTEFGSFHCVQPFLLGFDAVSIAQFSQNWNYICRSTVLPAGESKFYPQERKKIVDKCP
jgi:hypothetical protein